MNYKRVIPRDLFNEGNLLKCYGQLYLNLEQMGMADCLKHNGEPFNIVQDQSDGSLHISNVILSVRGEYVSLNRPLNSRDAYPLYLTTNESEELEVFDEHGRFTDSMLQFLKHHEPIQWHRIRNDINGNGRYVCHFLNLNTDQEKKEYEGQIQTLYNMALHRARKIGGRKFNNKQFGGGIVFQSSSIAETELHINRVLGEQA